jgi:hypothetical protein
LLALNWAADKRDETTLYMQNRARSPPPGQTAAVVAHLDDRLLRLNHKTLHNNKLLID